MSLSINPATSGSNSPTAVAGVKVNLPSLPVAIKELLRRAKARQGFTLFTLNLDHIVKLRRNAAFRAGYSRATFVTADGWPIVRLANRGGSRVCRAAGADLVEPLCEVAVRHGLSLYFVGPGEAALTAAVAVLRLRYPGLHIAGAESPAIPEAANPTDIASLAGRIAQSGARICLVSLGAPKQELVADRLGAICPEIGFICVGAALDFISGQSRRAPRWMRRRGLEWFWRLASEPRRLVLRYAACAYVFLLVALGFKAMPGESFS